MRNKKACLASGFFICMVHFTSRDGFTTRSTETADILPCVDSFEYWLQRQARTPC